MFSQFRLPWARTKRKEDSKAWLDDDSVAQSSLAIMLVGLTAIACALVTASSDAPSPTARSNALWVVAPIGVVVAVYGIVDLFYARSGRARPWWGWRASLIIRHEDLQLRWLRYKARRAHLCESKERCVRLMPVTETVDTIGHSAFVDVLMRMDSAG